jgi:MFS family permease
MLSDDSSQARTHAISTKSSSSTLQLFLACTGKGKGRQHDESNTTESASMHTVVRRTTSWRWVIVFGSFCVHFVADGVLFSFGILMHMIKDDLNIELHTVGIIASLFVSLPLLLAPLSSALVNKVGCRCMTMLGGFLCSMGLLFASLLGNFTGALIGIGITCGEKVFHNELLFSPILKQELVYPSFMFQRLL